MTHLRLMMASPVITAPPAGTAMESPAPISTTVLEIRVELLQQARAQTREPTPTSAPAAPGTLRLAVVRLVPQLAKHVPQEPIFRASFHYPNPMDREER